MANIQTIKYNPQNPEDKERIINVSASVGANGVNNLKDVIVVQALLKYALEGNIDYKGEEFPEPCGAFVKSTARLIKKYQRVTNRKNGVRVAIDGRIDPVTSNAYLHGTKKHWTLYSLHVAALSKAVLNGERTLIDALCRRWSFLRDILDYNGVGTLGLELE